MNLANCTKAELVKMANFRCQHRHTGLEHPECYFAETGEGERIAFFDIESSDLKATFGICLCYCLKPEGEEPITNVIRPSELRKGTFDKRLCKDFVRDLEKFDRVVGHYICGFDLPFMRTRCVKWGIPFPKWKSRWQKDTWVILKKKYKLHSNRLQVACDLFGIESKAHPMVPEVWLRALQGNRDALEYVAEHCREDVASTEALWGKICDSMALSKTSI